MAARNAQTAAAARQTQGSETQQQKPQSADALLKADHRKVEGLFKQCEQTQSSEEKSRLARQICKELIIHSTVEEEIFYPACREKNVEHDTLDEAQVEHDGAKILISELIESSPGDEFFDAKLSVLSEYIKHHVGEEEKARSGIFALAQKAGVDMAALGERIQARKQELMTEIDENRLEPPKPRSLHVQTMQPRAYQENRTMARQSSYRERDEQGRFMSDDDDYRRSSRSSRSSRDDDDERGRSFRSSRDDDDDRGGRSNRGWSGDPEGHAQAARRGWEERSDRGMQSRGRDDDYDSQRGRFSSGRNEDYESRGMQSGRLSRSRDDDDDDRRSSSRGRSQGGWFGDPEGHSEASQRGWESRGSSRGSRDDDDDGRRYQSRSSSRYDEDDDRRSSR